MKIRLTSRARRRIALVDRFWREERPAAPNLFDDELRDALGRLADDTAVGVFYRRRARDVVYSLLLPKTQQQLYYAVRADEALILTVWGARRRPGPTL